MPRLKHLNILNHEVRDGAVYFRLRRRPEYEIVVDEEDWERVKSVHWCLHFSAKNYAYIRGRIYRKRLQYLHHFILGESREIDHRNGNRLDNRKYNLRYATHSLNMVNRIQKRIKAPYRGVYVQRNKKWSARLRVNNNQLWLGTYGTPEEAAEAYNNGAKKYHGDFAVLNQIDKS